MDWRESFSILNLKTKRNLIDLGRFALIGFSPRFATLSAIGHVIGAPKQRPVTQPCQRPIRNEGVQIPPAQKKKPIRATDSSELAILDSKWRSYQV